LKLLDNHSKKNKKKGKIWIKIFPDLPITSKAIEKGWVKVKVLCHWGARVRGGNVLFEVCGVNLIP
jgi:large subunit ribosomal protein L16